MQNIQEISIILKLLTLLPSLKLTIVSPEWVSMEELALNLIKNGKLPANLLQGNLNDRLLLGRQSDLYNSLLNLLIILLNPILELKSYTTNPKVINQTLTSKLQVSANPVNDVLKVSFNLSTKEVLQLRVFNTQGVMVKSVEVDFKAGVSVRRRKICTWRICLEISSIEGAKLKSKFIKLRKTETDKKKRLAAIRSQLFFILCEHVLLITCFSGIFIGSEFHKMKNNNFILAISCGCNKALIEQKFLLWCHQSKLFQTPNPSIFGLNTFVFLHCFARFLWLSFLFFL